MSKFGDAVRSLFHRHRPVTRDEAAALSNWVNEGGAFNPHGPPPVLGEDVPDTHARRHAPRHRAERRRS